MTELSSFTASVTMREFGFFFFLRIAVEVSSSVFFSAPEASLPAMLVLIVERSCVANVLEIHLGLLDGMFRFARHLEGLCNWLS